MNILKQELAFFTGETPRRADLIIIHTISIIMGFVIAFAIPAVREATLWWQKLLIILLAWDDIGGVISNFTRSTNDYHKHRPRIRRFFYALHFLAPLVITLSSASGWIFFFFCWLYPVLGAVTIGELLPVNLRPAMAGALFSIGVIIYHYLIPVPVEWDWFGYVYLAKLILAYPLDHYPETSYQNSDE